MFGHADNVLSENSFQGWMGYKLSTPRVGYFFNCCFIPQKREGKRVRRERERAQARLGLRTAQDSEAPVNKSRLDCKRYSFTGWHRPVFSLSLSVSALKTAGWGRGQARAEVCHCWHRQGRMPGQFFLCCCDWIHFCGLGCVFRSSSRSLQVISVVGTDRLCVCAMSYRSEIIEQNTFDCFVYTTNPLIWVKSCGAALLLLLLSFKFITNCVFPKLLPWMLIVQS